MKKILYKLKKIFCMILALFIISSIIVGIPFLICFLGSILMHFLGLNYKSIWDLVIYFICFSIIKFPLDFLTSNFPKVLFKFNFISKHTTLILQIILNILSSILILSFLDLILKNINTSIKSIIGFSLFYAILSYIFEYKDIL